MNSHEARRRGETEFWMGGARVPPANVPHIPWLQGWDEAEQQSIKLDNEDKATSLFERLNISEEEFKFLVNYVRY